MRDALPFADRADFEQAQRGLVATLSDGVVLNERGSPLWDLPAYDFLRTDEAPDTVNPSLWRMAQLNMNNGLIIIDPLTTAEVARAGLDLFLAHRPEMPVRCVIYSHSHVDHYGGVMGVTTAEAVAAGEVVVIAPDRFMEEIAGENVLVGNAMNRRAQYQFGGLLAKGPRGQVDAGLGKVTARGRVTLIAHPGDCRGRGEPHHRRRRDGFSIGA